MPNKNEAVRRSEGEGRDKAFERISWPEDERRDAFDAGWDAHRDWHRAFLTASQLQTNPDSSKPLEQPERPQPGREVPPVDYTNLCLDATGTCKCGKQHKGEPSQPEDEWTLNPSRACKDAIYGPDFNEQIPVVRKSSLLAQRQRADEAERELGIVIERLERSSDMCDQAEAKVRELEGERGKDRDELTLYQHGMDEEHVALKAENTQLRAAIRRYLDSLLRHDGRGPDERQAALDALEALSPDPQGGK